MKQTLDKQRQQRYSESEQSYVLAIITDEDDSSQIELENGQTAWRSTLRHDKLTRKSNGDYLIEDIPEDKGGEHHLISLIAEGGRGAEFSELVMFGKHLMTFDDRTGLVCEIRNENQLVPRQILMTGSGDEKFKGFKSEWATIKGNELIVGSHGKKPAEEWIKVIGRNYGLQSINWHNHYEKLKAAAGVNDTGYIVHEAAEWHPEIEKWLFFPRKISDRPFEPDYDETCCGSNKLFIASEDFSDINVIEVGQATGERGVSSFKVVPGHPNECVALKSVEVGDRTETYFFAFDLDGNILHEEQFIGSYKCEGIEIL
jgi:soluble calcium-activated nucleotidase 1